MTDMSGTHSYGYDDLHRLTSASHPANSNVATKEEVFSYDAVGNRLADARINGYQYDVANRLLENSSFTYTYDANGNQTLERDKATNRATTYSYNSLNRIIQANLPDGTQANYKYDALGRRVEKAVGSMVTRYVYDGEDLLAMLDGNNDLISAFTGSLRIDEPLIMHKADGAEYFIHADGLGSIVAHSDANGNLIERIEYESYGETYFIDARGSPIPTIISTASYTGNPFAFTGREWDMERRRYYHRKRQTYNPSLGRFGQEDPIGLNGGDINFFAYAKNNPNQFSDPSGTDVTLIEYTEYGFGILHFGYRITNPNSPSGYTYFQFSPAWTASNLDILFAVFGSVPGQMHQDAYPVIYDPRVPSKTAGAFDIFTLGTSPDFDSRLIEKLAKQKESAAKGNFRYNFPTKNCITFPLYSEGGQ
jgi:RHS repeat-associated protein